MHWFGPTNRFLTDSALSQAIHPFLDGAAVVSVEKSKTTLDGMRSMMLDEDTSADMDTCRNRRSTALVAKWGDMVFGEVRTQIG
jgi:hypothetical protein